MKIRYWKVCVLYMKCYIITGRQTDKIYTLTPNTTTNKRKQRIMVNKPIKDINGSIKNI